MSRNLRLEPGAFAGGLHEVAPRTFAWLQPNGGLGEANAGLVVADGAAAVIDTLWDQRLAREMLAEMEAPTADAPVALAINTHSDGDHWWGNAELPAAAEIVTSAASLRAMRAELPPAALARMSALARRAGVLPGRVGAMGRYIGARLAPFDFGEIELRFPDRAFSGRRVEAAGGRRLELIEVGPAHTAGDLIVSVPDVGVVFAADVLFVGVTPVMWHGPVENWIAALDTLLGLEAEVYVPGHGPLAGREEVVAMRDYWSWVDAAVAEHHAKGRSARETSRRMIRDGEFARFRSWLDPERLLISVTTAHRARSGRGPLAPTPLNRARIFDGVAALKPEIGS